MRARDPDREGSPTTTAPGCSIEVFGVGEPTLVLVPSNPIVDSRQWKAQVPYLSRHYRVVTFDGRGNGRSDRPADPAAYTERGVPGRAGGGAGRHRLGPGGAGRAVPRRRVAVAAVRRRPSRAGGRHRRHLGRGAADRPAPRLQAARTASTRSSTPTRAGPSATATPGGATTAGSSSSSSTRCSPSPTRPSRSRTAWPGAWRPAWRPCSPPWTSRPSCRGTRWRRSAGGSGRRCCWSTATTTAASRWPGRSGWPS